VLTRLFDATGSCRFSRPNLLNPRALQQKISPHPKRKPSLGLPPMSCLPAHKLSFLIAVECPFNGLYYIHYWINIQTDTTRTQDQATTKNSPSQRKTGRQGGHHGEKAVKKDSKRARNTTIKCTGIQFAIRRREAKEMDGLATEEVLKIRWRCANIRRQEKREKKKRPTPTHGACSAQKIPTQSLHACSAHPTPSLHACGAQCL